MPHYNRYAETSMTVQLYTLVRFYIIKKTATAQLIKPRCKIQVHCMTISLNKA